MKKKLILMALALWSMVSVQAYGFEVDGISYGNSDTSVYVTSKNAKYSGSVVIPATVDWKGKTYTVTAIGNYAFQNCSGLTSITIPESVTSIGYDAFYNCSGLTSVTIPNSVTRIESYAFQNCSGLTSVTIPNSVTFIGSSAFSGCSGLTSVTIPNSVTTIESSAFSNCSGLTSITIPESVTSIGYDAFYNCSGLTSVTIPNSVTRIESYAFQNCSGLTSVTIPNSVTFIGSSAFSNCSGLTSVVWNAVDCYSKSDYYGNVPFYNCRNITTVMFGNNVKRIPAYLCYGLGLSAVTLPAGLKTIENCAFVNCGLTSVTIPEGVDTIGNSAFENCSSLASVTLPAGLASIGHRAFRYCGSLASVTLPAGLTFVGDEAFYGTAIATPLYNSRVFIYMPQSYSGTYTIPSGIQRIAGGAFSDCVNLTSVTIPNSMTTIGDEAFWNCMRLASVTLPESVDSVGNRAFLYTGLGSPLYNSKVFAYLPQNYSGAYAILSGIQRIAGGAFSHCVNLTSVTIPNSVTMIGAFAFYDCDGLTSVTIPEGVTTIGEGAFGDCDGLTSVMWNAVKCRDFAYSNRLFGYTPITSITFGDKVSYIPAYLCYGCNGLTSVTIPESVDSVGRYAFADCENLTSVEWNAVKCRDVGYRQEWGGWSGDYVFGYNPSLLSITFGDKVTHIPGGLCDGCRNLTAVTFSASVTSIGDRAFSSCSGLTSVTFPASVTSIGVSAFSSCSGLMSVTIPESLTSIGNYAFGYCDNLKSVTWNAVNCQVLRENDYSYSSPFYDYEKTMTITFGEKVTHIPAYLCYGVGLASVTLPASVTSIGKNAFENGWWGHNLVSVTSLAKNPPVCDAEGTFRHHKTLYVPRGCKEAYEEAPIWGYFNKIIELGNGGVVTLLVNDEDMGSVHGEGDYELGEEARLAAVPHWGYHFVRWDDGNTENPRMLTVTGDIELTAVFAKGNTINNDVPTDVANENLAQAPVLVSAAQGTIQVGDAHGECVSVYNLQGIRIYHAARLTGSADIPVPNPGVYVVKVNDWTVKLMVR